MSEQLAGLEKQLNDVFVTKAPYQLPEKAKKWIVEYSPIIGVVFGILGLLAAFGLWNAAHVTNSLVDYSNALSKAYGNGQTVSKLGVSFYLAFVALLATSIIPIVAYPGLKARSKAKGWNLLFISALVSLAYGILNAFYQGSVMSLLSTLLGSAIGLYILFQIREFYNGKKSKQESKK